MRFHKKSLSKRGFHKTAIKLISLFLLEEIPTQPEYNDQKYKQKLTG